VVVDAVDKEGAVEISDDDAEEGAWKDHSDSDEDEDSGIEDLGGDEDNVVEENNNKEFLRDPVPNLEQEPDMSSISEGGEPVDEHTGMFSYVSVLTISDVPALAGLKAMALAWL
jgi:hypothetical protein